MQISWILTNSTDGIFPKPAKLVDRANNGGAVYQIPAVRQEQVDFLKSRGLEIVTDRNAMGSGKAFLDTQYGSEGTSVVGALYAYKSDLAEKLGAVPHAISQGLATDSAPGVLISGY